ncbi:MurR/RpiR family transcriptional regulator [Thalassococcus lentus]|uniref:MurR/RpiR family transcriptional regulator n=1 Tax=Thalassococcus lentus TaxID=1210524 RepID=A0ABT4XUB1_9RHOB|nr:MurR/RpiR family transcriptional regulator [Thalassococcus lentus]MDA7425544.1 MurR/RpiR family transcriptional regulator [Thalassococcus lentus]
MTKTDAPADYEGLIRLIHDRFDQMSRTYQKIAEYLTQNPNDVAVHSVNAIAERQGVHASSFVRFAQSLGYSGFKDLQALFQQRLATAAPGFEARVNALEKEMRSREDLEDAEFFRDLVVSDAASVQGLLDEVTPNDLSSAADIISGADTIYLLGQLRSAPVVEIIRYLLTMAGKRCLLLDPSGGLSTHIARTIRPSDALLAVSFRFYANEVVSIAEEAAASHVPIVAISDSTLSPLAKSATVLLTAPEHSSLISRSLTAPICLAQALALAVAAKEQNGTVHPTIPSVTGTKD